MADTKTIIIGSAGVGTSIIAVITIIYTMTSGGVVAGNYTYDYAVPCTLEQHEQLLRYDTVLENTSFVYHVCDDPPQNTSCHDEHVPGTQQEQVPVYDLVNVTVCPVPPRGVTIQLVNGSTTYVDFYSYGTTGYIENCTLTRKLLNRGGSWDDNDPGHCWNNGVPCMQDNICGQKILMTHEITDRDREVPDAQ